LLGIGSERSASISNNDDIPTSDTTKIKQLINRVNQGKLDHGDAQLVEKSLNILLTIVSLLQRRHTSIRRMKELLFGMKEKKQGEECSCGNPANQRYHNPFLTGLHSRPLSCNPGS
jgi:hypothetical protein